MASASQKHRQVHHLSRDAGDPHGWVESITGLTADQPATDLLNNGSTASKQKAQVVTQKTQLLVALFTSAQLYFIVFDA